MEVGTRVQCAKAVLAHLILGATTGFQHSALPQCSAHKSMYQQDSMALYILATGFHISLMTSIATGALSTAIHVGLGRA